MKKVLFLAGLMGFNSLWAQSAFNYKSELDIHLINCPNVDQTPNTSVIVTELLQHSLIKMGKYRISDQISLAERFSEQALVDVGAIQSDSNKPVEPKPAPQKHLQLRGFCTTQGKNTLLKINIDSTFFAEQILNENELENNLQELAFKISQKSPTDWSYYLAKKHARTQYLGAFIGSNFAWENASGLGTQDEYVQNQPGGITLRFVSWNPNYDFEMGGTIPNHVGSIYARAAWWILASPVALVGGYQWRTLTISDDSDIQRYALNTQELQSGIAYRFLDKWRLTAMLGYQNGSIRFKGQYYGQNVELESDPLESFATSKTLQLDYKINENLWVSGYFYGGHDLRSDATFQLLNNSGKQEFVYRWSENIVGLSVGWIFGDD
jgi:hypothetical protein